MAGGSDRDVGVRIKTTAEGDGAAKAAAGIKGVGGAAGASVAPLGAAAGAATSLQAALSKLGLVVGLTAVLGLLRQIKDATGEQQRADAQLAAVIESTGAAAGKSVEELKAYAAALQSTTNFGDEAIQVAQAVLLTFTQIGGPEVDQATSVVLDMAAALGTDLKAASIQVGKALNDPVKGVSALAEVGVSFTAAQKKVIQSLVETGDVAGAQALILKELNVEFGGSAVAARAAGDGLTALGNVVGDLMEVFGSGLSPALRGAADDLTAAATGSTALEKSLRGAGATIGTVIEGYSLLIKTLLAFEAATAKIDEGDISGAARVFDDLAIASEQARARVREAWSGISESSSAGAAVVTESTDKAAQGATGASEAFEKWTEKLGVNREALEAGAKQLVAFVAELKASGVEIDKGFGEKLKAQVQDLLDGFARIGAETPPALAALAASLGAVTTEQEKLSDSVKSYLESIGKGVPDIEEFQKSLGTLGGVIAELTKGGTGSVGVTFLAPEAKEQLRADIQELLAAATTLGQQIPAEIAGAAAHLGLVVPAYQIAAESTKGVGEAQEFVAKSSAELVAEVEAAREALRSHAEASGAAGEASAAAGDQIAAAAAGVGKGSDEFERGSAAVREALDEFERATGIDLGPLQDTLIKAAESQVRMAEASAAAGEATEKAGEDMAGAAADVGKGTEALGGSKDAAGAAAEATGKAAEAADGLAKAHEAGATAAKTQAEALQQVAKDVESIPASIESAKAALEGLSSLDVSALLDTFSSIVEALQAVATQANATKAALDAIDGAGSGGAPEGALTPASITRNSPGSVSLTF